MDNPKNGVDVLRLGLRRVSVLEFARADDLIWRSAFLSHFLDPQKEEILAHASPLAVASEGHIFGQGLEAKSIFLVMSGTVTLSMDGLELASLSKGDFFGLAALIEDALRPAAQAERGGAQCAVFPAQTIAQLVQKVPKFGQMLTLAAAERKKRSQECSDFLDMW